MGNAVARGLRAAIRPAILTGLALVGAAAGWAAQPDGDAALSGQAPRLAGIVEGKPVYADDLIDREIQETRGKLYELESAKLRELALHRLRQSHPEEFALPPLSVSDAEVRKLYEEAQLSGRGAFEELEPRIRSYLERQQRDAVDDRHYQLALARGYVKPLLVPPPAFEVELAEVSRPASKGPRDAPVQIIEFSDFQCPFCDRARPIVAQVMEKYAGKVRLTYRHLPLTRIHPRAQELAEASECAGEQGRFWAFHDSIFDQFAMIETLDVNAVAKQAGVRDGPRFLACRESGRFRERVEEDLRAAESLEIGGTPTFLIGRRTGNGKIRGVLLEGAQPVAAFDRVIERVLEQGGK
jgi:protein-disulfide isomerase